MASAAFVSPCGDRLHVRRRHQNDHHNHHNHHQHYYHCDYRDIHMHQPAADSNNINSNNNTSRQNDIMQNIDIHCYDGGCASCEELDNKDEYFRGGLQPNTESNIYILKHTKHPHDNPQQNCCTKSRKKASTAHRTLTLTLTLALSILLVTFDISGVTALSCEPCKLEQCKNQTDCPGGIGLDVCRCCQVCAKVVNQSCGGPFGILGKCDRNLQCFLPPGNENSLDLEGVCKEIKTPDCTGPDCPPAELESLCPADSELATVTTNPNIASDINHRPLPPPPPPLVVSPFPASPSVAGSGHGRDELSNTNNLSADDEGEEEDDDSTTNDINSLDLDANIRNKLFGPASGLVLTGQTISDDLNDIPRDHSAHRRSIASGHLSNEVLTSFCVCSHPSTCSLPVCEEGQYAILVKNGTGIPGDCCDVYECRSYDKCELVMCPTVTEEKCPPDSVRLPPVWSVDECCQLQQKCICQPQEDCKSVWCPAGSQVQVISRASGQPGSCCDEFRCVNESRLTCSYQGKEIQNGEKWDIDKCKTCECRDGLNRCKDKTCAKLSCTWMVIPDGECCPVCRGCVSDSGELHNNSDVWRENDCTTCTCKDGHAQCRAEMCAVNCANAIRVPGQCCPVCPDEGDEEKEPVVARLCSGLTDCDLSCTHGLEQDKETGCFLCKCKPEPCDLECPKGFKSDIEGRQMCECKSEFFIDFSFSLNPTQQSSDCPDDLMCVKKCEYGYQRTLDGCIKCKCNRCPQVAKCDKTCLHGYLLNDDGCKLCKCKDAPSPSLTYPPMTTNDDDGRPCMTRSGDRHDDGESWNDGCRVCYCHNGAEMCSLISCPAPNCLNPVFRKGDCCPTCPGLIVKSTKGQREKCQSPQGLYYVEGATWELDECTHCVCHGGAILCQTPACPPVLCHHPIKPEGSCCAKCHEEPLGLPSPVSFPRHCKGSLGMFHKNGEIWKATPCQSCTCRDSQIQCYNQMCPPLQCERTVLKKGECCPTCVEQPKSEICHYSGTVYEPGEEWKGENCTQCICVGGKTKCFPFACPSLQCSVRVLRRGQCCPECYDSLLLKTKAIDKENSRGRKNFTDLSSSAPDLQQAGEINESSSAEVDANIVGFSVLGVLVFLLAIAVLLLVLFILRRKYLMQREPHSQRFRRRPKSTNLELQGHMPFIPPGSEVGTDGPDLHPKVVNAEKQLLEKLCPSLVAERETRASNPYTEMVFGEQVKDTSKQTGHFLASTKT